MGKLTIRQLIDVASKLDENKQRRFLEDIPLDYLIKMDIVSLHDRLDITNPRLYEKIRLTCETKYTWNLENRAKEAKSKTR